MNLAKKLVLSQLALASALAFAQGSLEDRARQFSNQGIPAKAVALLESSGGVTKRTLGAHQLHVYLLTDLQRFEEAVASANQLLVRAPSDARSNLAAGYAFRHSNALPSALSAYQKVLAVEPSNRDAQIGITRVLMGMGAPSVAYQLAAEKSFQLPQDLSAELKHAHAIQAMRQAPSDPTQAQERSKAFSEAAELLRDVTAVSKQGDADLVAALSRSGQHEEAVYRYRVLQVKNKAPDWLKVDVANSYSALKQYDKAQPLLEQAYLADPSSSEAWVALFYVYSDMMRMDQAQTLVDQVVRASRLNKSSALQSALALQVYSRLWANQLEAGQALALSALKEFPDSSELQLSYVESLLTGGRKGDARVQLGAIQAQNPSSLDVKLAMANLPAEGSRVDAMERNVEALEAEFPENSQVKRLRKQVDRSRKGGVYFAVETLKDEVSYSTRVILDFESKPLNKQGVRLAAGTSRGTSTVRGETVDTRFDSFGVVVPIVQGATVQARVTDSETATGARLHGQYKPSDDLTLSARWAKADDAVPSRAVASRTTADTLGFSVGYRPAISWELGASASFTDLSDGNQRQGWSASANKSGAFSPSWSYTWANRFGADTASRQDVDYFSPAKSSWAETELRVAKTLWVQDDHYFTVEPKASLGVIDQQGYATKPFNTVGIGFRYRTGDTRYFNLNVGSLHRPYDGNYSTQNRLDLSVYWVLP